MKISPRAKLALLASLFLLPMAASVVAYLFFPPVPTANYGELLLPPQTWPATLRRPSSERWLLVATEDPRCGPECIEKLAAMRKVRLALGRNASRVETAALGPAELSRAALDLDEAHIYLVDPHGNVMMRWPAHPDLKRMLRDIERLLKASQIG